MPTKAAAAAKAKKRRNGKRAAGATGTGKQSTARIRLPDLVGLKPAVAKKLRRKQAFLKAVGAAGQQQAAAADDEPSAFSTGLAELGAMLEATTRADRSEGSKAGAPARTTSNAAKQAVATKEVERLKTVLSHPVFQQDPHAALREHLKATLGSSHRK